MASGDGVDRVAVEVALTEVDEVGAADRCTVVEAERLHSLATCRSPSSTRSFEMPNSR